MSRRRRYDIDFGKGWSAGWAEYRHGNDKARPISLAGAKTHPVFRGDQRRHVIDLVVDMMRGWRQSPFEQEGAVTAGIRSALCLAGYRWHRADRQAKEIVSEALRLLGAVRPTWEQGQRHYVEPRENCKWCFAPIEDGDRLSGFCSLEHARAAHTHWGFETLSCSDKAYANVRRAIGRLSQKPRTCEACGSKFRPQWSTSEQRFCSLECSAVAKRVPIKKLTCAACGTDFEVSAKESRGSRGRSFCSPECGSKAPAFSPVTIRECAACGKSFGAKSPLAKFCSNACTLNFRRFSKGQYPKKVSPVVLDYLFRQQDLKITNGATRAEATITPAAFDRLLMAA
ncbi:hypothetical protein [Stappia sp.]|uniref:hypothetical protein n=1 Tax=Stappia sp. TaxID=1870903 RepID=UPI0025E0CAD0|nr:hypothetical protein [Stappia sp.]